MRSMYWHWRWVHRFLTVFVCLAAWAGWYVDKPNALLAFCAGMMLMQALDPIDYDRAFK